MNETCAYLFNSHNFSSFGKLITEMYFNSVEQETFAAGQFAREVMYEREHVSFIRAGSRPISPLHVNRSDSLEIGVTYLQ